MPLMQDLPPPWAGIVGDTTAHGSRLCAVAGRVALRCRTCHQHPRLRQPRSGHRPQLWRLDPTRVCADFIHRCAFWRIGRYKPACSQGVHATPPHPSSCRHGRRPGIRVTASGPPVAWGEAAGRCPAPVGRTAGWPAGWSSKLGRLERALPAQPASPAELMERFCRPQRCNHRQLRAQTERLVHI
jgi:hypothetical protein